ncbi:hypothetical protein L208DRAFT_1553984, partial [Tricholoma matsutake]
MIITFMDPDSTNKAILCGLVICNKKVSVTKCKRELIRCLKCQGYNHVAHECIISRDICARCRENHRTSDCSAVTLLCTPCRKHGHASNDCMCPTFLRKCNEHDERNLENLLPFYPSTETWTWEAAPPSNQRATITTGLSDFVQQNRRGLMQQTQLNFQPRHAASNEWGLERQSWDRQAPK